MTEPALIHRQTFEVEQLLDNHPPILSDRNKKLVFDIAYPVRTVPQGGIEYSQWCSPSLSQSQSINLSSAALKMISRGGFYDYLPSAAFEDAMEWHVNFADAHLFGYYGGGLMAQDELQVAEHPVLGAA